MPCTIRTLFFFGILAFSEKMRISLQKKPRAKWPVWPLRAVDVLSMEIIMDNAIESASHAQECWPHVIRCVLTKKGICLSEENDRFVINGTIVSMLFAAAASTFGNWNAT